MTDTTENRLPSTDTTARLGMLPIDGQTSQGATATATDDDVAEDMPATPPKIDSGTVSRFLVLLLALVNQALTMFGHPVLNIDDTTITQLASLAWTAGSAIWCYWKDNDVTKAARTKKARLSARHAA